VKTNKNDIVELSVMPTEIARDEQGEREALAVQLKDDCLDK
jgi:hypothetical protein